MRNRTIMKSVLAALAALSCGGCISSTKEVEKPLAVPPSGPTVYALTGSTVNIQGNSSTAIVMPAKAGSE